MITLISDRERELMAERDALQAKLNQQQDMVEKCMVAMNRNADIGQAAEKERDALKADASRYRWLQSKTRGIYGVTSDQEFVLPHVQRVAGQDLMRGSIAQHLDRAIDAAMAVEVL